MCVRVRVHMCVLACVHVRVCACLVYQERGCLFFSRGEEGGVQREKRAAPGRGRDPHTLPRAGQVHRWLSALAQAGCESLPSPWAERACGEEGRGWQGPGFPQTCKVIGRSLPQTSGICPTPRVRAPGDTAEALGRPRAEDSGSHTHPLTSRGRRSRMSGQYTVFEGKKNNNTHHFSKATGVRAF